MKWIKLKGAIKLAGVTERTAHNHLKFIKNNPDKHQRNLIRKVEGQIEVRVPQVIIHFQSDLRKLSRSKIPKVKSQIKIQDKNHSKTEDPFHSTDTPLLISEFPQVGEIIKGVIKKDYFEKVWKCILICDEYMIGRKTLDRCCQNKDLDPSTFWRWRTIYDEIRQIFNFAREIRIQSLFEWDKEKLDNTLRKHFFGYSRKLKTKTYKTHLNPDGTYTKILKEIKVVQKYHPPNASAIGDNRDALKWIHSIVDENLRPRDIFDKMTEQELDDYIEKSRKKEEQERNKRESGQ